jgi:hypothetical protein
LPDKNQRDTRGRWAVGNHNGGRPRGARNKKARATVASLVAHGELLPREALRQIGLTSKSEAIRVQAMVGAAPYYAPKFSPAPILPTSINLPPITDVQSTIAAQRLVVEAMAGGRLDMAAGQALINSFALMVKTAEMANASVPQTILVEGSLIHDLPIDPDDPANQHFEHVNTGPQPGAEAPPPPLESTQTPVKRRA